VSKDLDIRLNQSKANIDATQMQNEYYETSPGSHIVKLENFTKYVSRENITRFLARNEVFLKQLDVHGSILDFGVRRGASLMTWSHLSSIYEPTNYTREIIGFDTFEGFPEVSEKDMLNTEENKDLIFEGSLNVEKGMKQDIEKAIGIWDKGRYLNHIQKTKLVEGDILKTLPQYIENNPHLLVSLLHIDVDIYEPTKCILDLLLPRIPKGGIILFDELHMRSFPGETVAVHEALGLSSLEIKRFTYAPNISYVTMN